MNPELRRVIANRSPEGGAALGLHHGVAIEEQVLRPRPEYALSPDRVFSADLE
ncbi:hypothetical protein NIE79_004660 [Micromonospora sp. NIE79]|uniref:Uncharacterized protein n=1 Tax=Micromonospora trifolii TaxID=2911208 RepID=A0ABS9N8U1_9ACTN|nr:hypothetical protein [Micromonospora trifolii]MCG5446095.1 hypothetical protein [Micromonospora trifolii]